MATLRINSDWIDSEDVLRPEIDHSYGRLGIALSEQWLTANETESGIRDDRLEVPAYFLAEWIAENWWSLLYEPEKGDKSRTDPGFRARHWLGTARSGFVLPDTWLFSLGGGHLQLRSDPSFFPHARLVLRVGAEGRLRIEDVAGELTAFIDGVVRRLDEKGVRDTNLHAIWAAYRALDPDERRFCQLLGALGLSPYDAPPETADLLTSILGDKSDRVTEDFCDAADEDDILGAASDMVETLRALDGEPEIDLAELFRLRSRDRGSPKSVALEAVGAVRERFGIAEDDPRGGESFLNALALNGIVYDRSGIRDMDEPVLHGSLRRHENVGQVNLIRRQIPARRFDAARACYLAWTQATDGDRLVTRARVPDQQASRIFAAELLAPIQFIRRRTRNNLLSQYGVASIASELEVSNAVVAWQAAHNRVNVVGHHGDR